MQQIEIKIVGAEAPKARFARTRHAIVGHLIRCHFRDQEYLVASTSDDAADQFLRVTATI